MKAKKPVKMITCPLCKGSDFHYDNSLDNYKCRNCGHTFRGK